MVTPTRLYPLYCTLYLCILTLIRWHQQMLVALSFAFRKSRFSFQTYCVHFIGYNLASAFSLRFHFEIYKLFTLFFCWKFAVATTALNFEHVYFCCPYFCLLPLRSSTLGCHPTQHTFFISGFLTLTLFVSLIPTDHFSVSTFDCPYHFVH